MKYIVISLISLFFLTSCEDVIDLELDSVEPRLVIDAALERQINEDGEIVEFNKVILSLTTDVFDATPSPVNFADVSITNMSNEDVFRMRNVNNRGEFSIWPDGFPVGFPANGMFQVENDVEYKLTVIHEGETYEATEVLNPSVPIDFLLQFEDTRNFKEPQDVAFTIAYTDRPGEGDFYTFNVNNTNFITTEDTFIIDGAPFDFDYFFEDPPSENLVVYLKGSDQNTNDYVDGITELSDGGGNGPFNTVPFQLKGNIVNTTNADNFPFGYFRVSEVYSSEITLVDNEDAPSADVVDNIINSAQ